jgi:SAM-dependent methyltransferase
MMSRALQPELLDTLPPGHPDAQHSRRDLRTINWLMGNHRWLTSALLRGRPSSAAVLELGAGTGELGARINTHGVAIDGLDLGPRPAAWPDGGNWHQADLRDFQQYDSYPVVIGSLIFHHFSDHELRNLGRQLGAHARLILACEPARLRRSQRLIRVLGPLFRANRVTMHDAIVSIAAGFCADELPRLLGLDASTWQWSCVSGPFGAYRFAATRRP